MRRHWRILVVLLLALVVRLVLINQSFWLDEAAQAAESTRPLSQQLSIAYDFQPPLFHLVVHFFSLYGVEEAWLRMSSVLSGLVTVAMTYFLAQLIWKKEEGERIGLFAALFLALSSLHVYFSQELRPYAFAAMWAVLSWFFLLKHLQKRQSIHLLLFTLVSAAGFYSMYLYPFLFLSQLLYIFFYQKTALRQFLIASGGVALLFLPWLPSFLEQLHVGSVLRVSLPGWSEVVSVPQLKVLPLIGLKFIGGLQPINLNAWVLIYLGIPVLLLSWTGFYIARHYKKHQHLSPILIWLVVPIVLAWAVSFIVPVLSVKRVLMCLPAFYLFVALAVETLLKKNLQKYAMASILMFELIGLVLYWSYPTLQRERWREVRQDIYANYSTETTIVVFGFDAPFAPWTWYDQDRQLHLTTLTFPSVPVKDPLFPVVMEKTLKFKTVLVFDYLRDLTDPSRRIDSWLLSHGFEQGQIIDTLNMGFVREYTKTNYVSLN